MDTRAIFWYKTVVYFKHDVYNFESMDHKQAMQAYANGLVKKKASVADKLVPSLIGAGANAFAANRLADWSTGLLGATDDEKKYSVPMVTAAGALTGLFHGNRIGSALQRAVASGQNRGPVIGKYIANNLKNIGLTTMGVDALGTPAAIAGMRVNDSLKANTDLAKQKINEVAGSISDRFPGGLGGLVAAGVLSTVGASALWNISRAASRVADGRVVRTSLSLRKRPGQITDVNFGVMPFKAKDERLNPMIGRAPDPILDSGDED